MTPTADTVQALRETRPPATDRFTYLTLVEKSLTPEILPDLNDILQDAQLTQEIGWDLVDMLLPLEGCEACLETVARLGNPREVILKVLEALEVHVGNSDQQNTSEEEEDEDVEEEEEEEAEAAPETIETSQASSNHQQQQPSATSNPIRKFIVLLGMLAILHKRIKTKSPSRFLATSLATVFHTYQPNADMTAAVINLVQALSGTKRPPLPTRKSSKSLVRLEMDRDTTRNAPDPEAEKDEAAGEEAAQQRLLLVFVLSVLEVYVNVNELQWARRLVEYLHPERIVPRTMTALVAFRQDEVLAGRDDAVGKLVALAHDLGLTAPSPALLHDVSNSPVQRDPLAQVDGLVSSRAVPLPTGGVVAIVSYWVFASTVFGSHQPRPQIHLLPEHGTMLENFLGPQPQSTLAESPGVVEALVVIALWLEDEGRILSSETVSPDFMAYLHQVTLCAVLHPSLYVRNAATGLAGAVLHADPDPADRLKILADLLENCVFSALQACAVSWLREEIIDANKEENEAQSTIFSSSECIDDLQYFLFPNLDFFTHDDYDVNKLLEYWAENSSFVLQAVNFAYFLLSSKTCRHMVPNGLAAAIEHRYVEPLKTLACRLRPEVTELEAVNIAMELDVLQERLGKLPLH